MTQTINWVDISILCPKCKTYFTASLCERTTKTLKNQLKTQFIMHDYSVDCPYCKSKFNVTQIYRQITRD